MIFSSLPFLFAFLPLFLAVYYVCPARWRNASLLCGSLVFYGIGVKNNLWMLALLLLSAFINYRIGSRIAQSVRMYRRKQWLLRGIVYNLFWLILFKYTGFISENINAILQLFGLPALLETKPFPLPLGISFYTFAALSYLVDVYRRDVKWERSLPRFATWFCMFPQVTSGPITRYQSQQKALLKRTYSMESIENGLREFTIGLGLKVLLANRLGGLWSAVGGIGYESISTPLAWMGIAAFSFQLYFDFCGYSLMAKGLGTMLGFTLPDNFNHPYIAVSMTEFWRRWHITLGAWFRDYIYIPLGGSREGRLRTVRNLLVVWLLTGIWHGASWNFVIWGLSLFLLIALEKQGLLRILEGCRPVGHLYMLLIIPLTWLIFALPLPQAVLYLKRLFPFLAAPGTFHYFAGDAAKYGMQYGIFLLAGFLFMTPLPRKLYERDKKGLVTAALLLLVFWLSVRGIMQGANDPFLYFNF